MERIRLTESTIWPELAQEAVRMNRPENHLKHLTVQQNRLKEFSLRGAGMFYDFARQRVDRNVLSLLLKLAEQCRVKEMFADMVAGGIVNTTEKRAALHTATRDFTSDVISVNGHNVVPETRRVLKEIRDFAEQVHGGKVVSASGRPFRHAVVVGIGGSYLGAEFVATALRTFADKEIHLHFLSNVDIHDFGRIVSLIDPETTLWIVISKSYTTAETEANVRQIYAYLQQRHIDPAKHCVTVTAKGSPGDDPGNPVLRSFHMFDYIGGRYSVTSAVGGVPLSLYLGFERFEEFLRGAEEMDRHAAEAPAEGNIPLMAALIGIWNNNFLGYSAQAIIPYAMPLCKLAPHVQQVYMESNGKSVTKSGGPVGAETGVIVFGEPGTNAQHSFFQLAHQGRPFPIDFIGVVNPQYDQYRSKSKGVTNHQELWSNLISQPRALAEGRDNADPAKCFEGNRPSSTILLNALTPRDIGRLLSFYEARTVYEAFVWDINPFDQFGVELGKTMASDIRKAMAARNDNPGFTFDGVEPIGRFYLETLFKGGFES